MDNIKVESGRVNSSVKFTCNCKNTTTQIVTNGEKTNVTLKCFICGNTQKINLSQYA